MKNLVFLSAIIGLSTSVAMAQDSTPTAMEVAQSQNACGQDENIVSARYLDDGRVGVQCSAGAVASANCVPFVAAAGDDRSQLRALRIAERQNACDGSDITNARFSTENEIRVTCSSAAGATIAQCPSGTVLASGNGGAVATAAAGAVVATNFVPIAGGLFAVVLGAAAAGSGSSTSDTQ